MHDIIEHYGKVVIALAGVLAAVLLTGTPTHPSTSGFCS